MADEPAGRTSLGVLHEILNNLGDSNTYLTVVDALEALKNLLGEGGIGEAVSEWLAAHPEATTTVQNGSITLLKLANDVKSAINGKAESSDLQTLADNLEALAQAVRDTLKTVDGLGLPKAASGTIVTLEYPACINAITASTTGDAFTGNVTVVGGENMLAPSEAATIERDGVTIVSDGNGSYTLSGASHNGFQVFLRLGSSITLPMDIDNAYLHIGNDGVQSSAVVGLGDANSSWAGNGVLNVPDRVLNVSDNAKGKTISYVGIYVSANITFSTPITVHPMLMTTSKQGVTGEFEGIVSGAGNTISSVPSNRLCYVWANDSTLIDVSYSVGTSYTESEISELRESLETTSTSEIMTAIKNARHIAGGQVVEPITLLHLSDLHADSAALGRIMAESVTYGEMLNGAICTGDMVANTYGQISDWWNPSVMTCIGNHDTASYNSSTGYNWTALSMADRDAYYIAPFESEWGITHAAGTSYYYKDYAAAKVRLIVMDGMLYMSESTSSQASEQTAWLSSLLTGAVSAGLHVLIAIHSPHGGAAAIQCSFSRVGQVAMPTNHDCDTPQTVIDAVATAIDGGLNFIGYIVGHTHQDNIWDVSGDGKQLMYCVTCANVSYAAQWANSDQSRDDEMDAYNLVTIDTAHKLVKLVRGGGADMDDAMRPRKAICINYSTGTIVGQTL